MRLLDVLPIVCVGILTACGSGGSDSSVPACDPGTEFCGTIPTSAFACTGSQYWPLEIQSGQYPLSVHYAKTSEEEVAADMLAILDNAWQTQVETIGFAAPLGDGGSCGPDDRYDVFVWQGVEGAFVEAIVDNPQTSHDDYSTYIAIDPFGDFGDVFLDTTLAHEFNHAVQASDDWWESALMFEMTATFAEALVYPDQDDYFYVIEDFQLHPEWSLFYDDNYATWYMYGAAMYLHFLQQRYYEQDPGFVARIWRNMRSDPADGRPDFIDAMRAVLVAERGVALDDTVVEFMQWRWFTGEFDDGLHFTQGADWGFSVPFQEIDAGIGQANVQFDAMIYGAGYLRIVNPSAGQRQFSVALQNPDPDVIWRVTTERGEAVAGSVTVPPQSSIVIIATVLPAAELSAATLDFDTRTSTLLLDAL
ncbi:MAG: hypothetical protein ACREQ8_06735 [Woeseiaceae bacterium]